MWEALILLLLEYITLSYVLCDGSYECGDHGRFEYCIDEIPGCVIGCHCHPGYYFDTDSKICEPNSKLIENHRRQNVKEPTEIRHLVTPHQTIENVATTSKIDAQVDGISKDAEDLGDWLYNQFFKTIENQVVNNTNDKNILTRRSGTGPSIKTPKRKTKNKKRGGSRHRKKENLRKKLLRITENDSVFDMPSGSESDSRESSSSSSDSSYEYEKYHDHDDDEHGHKKIVMINKKPKPPLPNFIFLPNLDTPFYPPIGLPPPMYPIVPVPPLITLNHKTDCSSSSEETTAAPKTTATASITTSIMSEATIHEDTSVTTPSEPITEDKPPGVLRHPKRKPKDSDRNLNDLRLSKLMAPNRHKFLQRLKHKMKNQSPKSLKENHFYSNNFPKQNTNLDPQYPENILPADPYLNNYMNQKPQPPPPPPIQPSPEGPPHSENVDFKYLTELIHRVDLKNGSDVNNYLPPTEYNPLDSIELYQPPKINQNPYSDYITPLNLPERRFNRPKYHQSDDSYYMNLGRQIASMIRGIDTQNREVDIKLETTQDIPKNDLYLNANSPRSYWERSVRSPLTFLKSNKKRFEYLKRSNELLFDIENKVKIVASTVPTLSLREIENIVKLMETAKRDMQYKETKVQDVIHPPNNVSINLWPHELLSTRNLMKNSMASISNYNFKQTSKKPEMSDSLEKKNNLPDYVNSNMLNNNRFAVRQKPPINEKSHSNLQIADIKPKIKPASYLSGNPINYHQDPQYGSLNKKPAITTFPQQSSGQSLWENEMNPLFLKHRKYFGNNNNYFQSPNENLAHTLVELKPQRITKPSYFQNEINFFDYIF